MSEAYALPHNNLTSGPADVYDAQPSLSPVERITNTFLAPSKTFADVRRNRSWWFPFVLMALFGYVFSGAVLTQIGPVKLAETSIRNNPAQNERMQSSSPEQRAQTLRYTAAGMQGTLLALPVFILAFGALEALLLWAGFNFLLGGSATYSGMFAVAMFASLPSILRSLLVTAVVFAGDPDAFNLNDPIGTNPGFFMGLDSSVFLKSVLGSVDFFSLWILLLCAIGGAIVARVKVSSGITLVFSGWLLYVLVKSGIVAAMS